MAKNDFDTHALLQFIGGSVGKTLADIAQEFGVSIRTVQRRLRELRTRYSGLDIRETQLCGVKAFRYVRRGIALNISIKLTDIITLHRLRLAATLLHQEGMNAHAETLHNHVENLMRAMPRAHRTAVERKLQRLCNLEQVKLGKSKAAVRIGVYDAIQLASIAERKIDAVLLSGEIVHGEVEAVSYDINGKAEAMIRLQDGHVKPISLAGVRHIRGVMDLLPEGSIRD